MVSSCCCVWLTSYDVAAFSLHAHRTVHSATLVSERLVDRHSLLYGIRSASSVDVLQILYLGKNASTSFPCCVIWPGNEAVSKINDVLIYSLLFTYRFLLDVPSG